MERGLLNIVNHGDQSRFTHIIICLTEAGAFAQHVTPASCRIVELHKRPGHDFGLIGDIASVARQYNVDILHARGWPALVETAMAARLAKVRATIYGFHGKTMADLSRTSVLRRAVQALAIRAYSKVVTLNSRMQKDLAFESYLPETRIDVIANGVDLTRFTPVRGASALRSRYALPLDRLIVGNVARLDPVKNHEVLLRAVARIAKDRQPPFVLIVGDGDHRPMLEREIQVLGLTKHIALIGYSNDVPDLLNCMDVYVQSSHYEGFSNTVLEAMACGLPIVASDVGGTRDLFSDGQEGKYFWPDDVEQLANILMSLQEDPAGCRIMGERARLRVVETFSLEAMVGHYDRMYQGLAIAS